MKSINITSACLTAAVISVICASMSIAQSKEPTASDTNEEFLDMSSGKTEVLKMVPSTLGNLKMVPASTTEMFPAPLRPIYDLKAAREYMLKLINRDRFTLGLSPVVMDEIASKAGQLHSDEMAKFGYLSHWGLDGKKPDQRYTEAGGRDADAENASGLSWTPPPVASPQEFNEAQLEQSELGFFGEKPPLDGHRTNIIDPAHTAVGLGLTVAGGVLYCTQEFINHYGEYSDIPNTLKPGDKFTLTGKLASGTHLYSIDLRREGFPKPMSRAELSKTYAYTIPDTTVADYFPNAGEHQITINSLEGCEQFSIEISTEKSWKQGVYYVLIFASLPTAKKLEIISLRTFQLQSK